MALPFSMEFRHGGVEKDRGTVQLVVRTSEPSGEADVAVGYSSEA